MKKKNTAKLYADALVKPDWSYCCCEWSDWWNWTITIFHEILYSNLNISQLQNLWGIAKELNYILAPNFHEMLQSSIIKSWLKISWDMTSFCLCLFVFLSFCIFVFLSFCLFVFLLLWSNVWRVSSLKSLCIEILKWHSLIHPLTDQDQV